MVAKADETAASFSEVTVVGRLGARVDERELPSGDVVTVFTVIVDRKERSPSTGQAKGVDAIACQTFRPAVARRVGTLDAGQWVRVEGALRRRFWRSGAGLGSAMEVDVRRIQRVTSGAVRA